MIVTILSSLPPVKGISKYTAALLRGFSADQPVEALGFKQLYPERLYPGSTKDASLQPLQQPNVDVRQFLTWYNPLGWLWAGLTLRGQVVHAQWWTYVVAPPYLVILSVARYLRRKKIVITVHNVKPHESGKLKDIANRAVVRLGNHYIVHSEANKQVFVREYRVDAAQVSVIPHGILLPDAPITGMSQTDARRSLRLPIDGRVILFFGIIRDYKGLDVLLESMPEIRRRVGDTVRLVIAGKPWQSWQPYETLIERLDLGGYVQTHLEFIPEEDIETYYAAADVVALPYRHFDAQSGAGTQCLAFGKAMVVTAVGGLPGLVKTDQAVCRPDDAADLAHRLSAVLLDGELRRQLERDARELAQELSWETIARQTQAVYAKCVSP